MRVNRPIVLAGGATGLIGDPRDVGERTMNSADTVAEWADRIRGQLERFVDFDDSASGAIIENNMNWTGKLSAIDFLRDVGKHFSVNVMLARDTVKRRLESDGMSYTEFSYMLLQANDYLHLRRSHGCSLQVGGSDQWGNIIAGRRTEPAHRRRVGARSDRPARHVGGRQEVREVDRRRKPVARPGDDESLRVVPVLREHRRRRRGQVPAWFTFLTAEESAELETATAERPHAREAQRRLAAEMTTLVHGEANTRAVELASQALFGRAELQDLDEPTLGAALREASVAELAPGEPGGIVDLLVLSGLCESKGAARRTVKEGGASVNNQKISSEDWTPAPTDLLHGTWLVIRRGKRNFAGIKVLSN